MTLKVDSLKKIDKEFQVLKNRIKLVNFPLRIL